MQHHHVSHVTHRSPHLDAESLQVSVGEHDSCLAGAPLGRIGLPPAPDTPHDSHKGMALPLTVTSVIDEALSRGRWLLGLLICQSMSAKILESFRELIRDHLVVTLFLTMLVGAGGNAGNQSAIKVIRGLATGSIVCSWPCFHATMREQSAVGLLLGAGLSAGGFVRVFITNGNLTNAFAISLSLFLIVNASVLLGTTLPFLLARAGVDPANAGTSIQVAMDILGVAITCATCHIILMQVADGLKENEVAA